PARPVAVVTTSGTAAVNLHPAVVEASYGGVPLIALTADRPPRLRGVGAHQTINQVGLFASAIRAEFDLTAATSNGDADADAVRAALAVATDVAHPGPVHLNIALDEPLVDPDFDLAAALGQPIPRSASTLAQPQMGEQLWDAIAQGETGLIVVGDVTGMDSAASAVAINEFAARTGWPVLTEPSAPQLLVGLQHGALLLGDQKFMADHHPETVVTVGRVGLHRSVMSLLRSVHRHIVVDPRPTGWYCDPFGTAKFKADALPARWPAEPAPTVWLDQWIRADADMARQVEQVLSGRAPFAGPLVARKAVASLNAEDQFVIGPSWPMRHVGEAGGHIRAHCIANRGTSGIDGIISTTWGAALRHGGYTLALIGDLTSVYDRNGLLGAPGEEQPHLTYLVVDNDGGGIFHSLEQAAPQFAADFERVFGTPRGYGVAQLLATPGVSVTTVHDTAELHTTLVQCRAVNGVHIVVAQCEDRSVEADVVTTLRNLSVVSDLSTS
ncbi:MAG: 2-succinyl-5-enolpyruvyl-6-hydroxy-3-cyclohexene-1-carboxylic-acid synthase, partial [Actinomycetes bacterium]